MDDKRRRKERALPRAALSYLRKAGWAPDRAVSTLRYKKAFESEGIALAPTVERFLREFGGLVIPYGTPSRQEDVLEFLADRAVQGMGGGAVQEFEELIGSGPLCPIGHYLFGTCMLFMDSRGRVFGGSDEAVTFVGKTGDDAIGNIMTSVPSELVEPKTRCSTIGPDSAEAPQIQYG